MIRFIFTWLMARLAEHDAIAQRKFAVKLEQDWHDAQRGINHCDAMNALWQARLRQERLSRRFRIHA